MKAQITQVITLKLAFNIPFLSNLPFSKGLVEENIKMNFFLGIIHR